MDHSMDEEHEGSYHKVCQMGVNQVQILCMDDSLLLSNYVSHKNIAGDGRQERLCKPICEELV
jgi:hypothetical protein